MFEGIINENNDTIAVRVRLMFEPAGNYGKRQSCQGYRQERGHLGEVPEPQYHSEDCRAVQSTRVRTRRPARQTPGEITSRTKCPRGRDLLVDWRHELIGVLPVPDLRYPRRGRSQRADLEYPGVHHSGRFLAKARGKAEAHISYLMEVTHESNHSIMQQLHRLLRSGPAMLPS